MGSLNLTIVTIRLQWSVNILSPGFSSADFSVNNGHGLVSFAVAFVTCRLAINEPRWVNTLLIISNDFVETSLFQGIVHISYVFPSLYDTLDMKWVECVSQYIGCSNSVGQHFILVTLISSELHRRPCIDGKELSACHRTKANG